MSERVNCSACDRTIDAAAKICPYCGVNTTTGERVDTQAILQEIFQPREVSKGESVLEYARQRQGIVIAVSAFVGFLLLAAMHQYVTARNNSAVTDSPAVPLSEFTDVTRRADEAAPVPMPKVEFQYDGKPQSMRTYIAERGEVTPPEVLAAQQAAQPEAQAKAAAANNPAQAPQTGVAARPAAGGPLRPAPAGPLRPAPAAGRPQTVPPAPPPR
jgi:hypothetical protein